MVSLSKRRLSRKQLAAIHMKATGQYSYAEVLASKQYIYPKGFKEILNDPKTYPLGPRWSKAVKEAPDPDSAQVANELSFGVQRLAGGKPIQFGHIALDNKPVKLELKKVGFTPRQEAKIKEVLLGKRVLLPVCLLGRTTSDNRLKLALPPGYSRDDPGVLRKLKASLSLPRARWSPDELPSSQQYKTMGARGFGADSLEAREIARSIYSRPWHPKLKAPSTPPEKLMISKHTSRFGLKDSRSGDKLSLSKSKSDLARLGEGTRVSKFTGWIKDSVVESVPSRPSPFELRLGGEIEARIKRLRSPEYEQEIDYLKAQGGNVSEMVRQREEALKQHTVHDLAMEALGWQLPKPRALSDLLAPEEPKSETDKWISKTFGAKFREDDEKARASRAANALEADKKRKKDAARDAKNLFEAKKREAQWKKEVIPKPVSTPKLTSNDEAYLKGVGSRFQSIAKQQTKKAPSFFAPKLKKDGKKKKDGSE